MDAESLGNAAFCARVRRVGLETSMRSFRKAAVYVGAVFLIGVLGPTGCDSSEDDSGTGGQTFGNFCPDGFAAGQSCSTPGAKCALAANECGGGSLLTCNASKVWEETQSARCCWNASYPNCPAAVPTAGDTCEVCIGASACAYNEAAACGTQLILAECDEQTKAWKLTNGECK